MLSSLMSVLSVFFFAAVAMGAAALLGSLLFDLVPVLRNGDDRLRRQSLVFPQVQQRREPATVYRLTATTRIVEPVSPLRAAA